MPIMSESKNCDWLMIVTSDYYKLSNWTIILSRLIPSNSFSNVGSNESSTHSSNCKDGHSQGP